MSINESFLAEYVDAYSATGHEVTGQKIWMDYIRPFVDEIITDPYGSAVGIVNPGQDFKVVIEAHADEISWIVNYIDSKGFIHVLQNGGSDAYVAPAMRVSLHGDKEIIQGVFGWPAIHTRRGKESPVPKTEKIFIDVGAANKEEVLEMGIRPGTIALFDQKVNVINNKFYCGKALDNKIGGVIIAEAVRRISESKDKLPFSLYVVNAVQEEVGLRGAQMIANRIKPDLAVVVDVTHDSRTPMISKEREGDMGAGDGPVLVSGPAVHNLVFKRLRKVAEDQKIPFQFEAASRSTGTDTDAFAYSNSGVPSALIAIAQRYMHTPVEMVSKDDVENAVNLFVGFLRSLSGDSKEFSYY